MKFENKVHLILCTIIIFAMGFGYYISNNHPHAQKFKVQQARKYQALIFDLDGTILDTDKLWKLATSPILDSHAPHLMPEEKAALVAQYQALTIHEVWNIVKNSCSLPITFDEIIEENIKHLHTLYKKEGIDFIPYFHEFHTQVINAGLKTAIATSSQGTTIDVITSIIPLDNYFNHHIYHADHVGKTYKPNPAVYLHAAQMLGVAPHRCIAIEDSPSGIKAAKAAGMYCIGINTCKNKALLQQADEIVDCFSAIDLEKLLTIAR